MKQVELQIWNNQQQEYVAVDLDRSTQFPFVFEFNDVQNPTAIKVEWSKQINLPMTKLNNDLFSQIWKFDSIIYNFNPLIRTNFRLYVNADLFQSGYIKLESITNQYNVRLFGGLAEYFYLLSESKLKDMDKKEEFSHIINMTQISNFWTEGKVENIAKEDISSSLGYAMTYQGEYDNFDPAYVIKSESEGKTEVKWTDSKKFLDNDKENAEYSNPTLNEHRRTFMRGITPYYGEYRSYYQKPMVRVKTILEKIFSHMQQEGWNTKLDQSFFNIKNPYYNDLWIICPQYSISDSSVTQFGKFTGSANDIFRIDERGITSYKSIPFKATTTTSTLEVINNGTFSFSPNQKTVYIKVRVPFRIRCINDTNNSKDKNYYFTSEDSKKHQKKLTIHIRSKASDSKYEDIIFKNPDTGEEFFDLRRDTVNGFNPFRQKYLSATGKTYEGEDGGEASIFYMEANIPYEGGDTYTRNIEAAMQYFSSSHNSTVLYTSGGTYRNFHFEFEPLSSEEDTEDIEAFAPQDLRTNSVVTWKNIMTSEHSYFDFLISYAKIFGLLFTKSKYNKTVTIQTRNTYFARQEKVDWTDKLDYSKQRNITPLGFEYRVGEFKWAELNTKYEEDYLNRTNRAYGSMRFNNNYYYTNQEVNFLDGIIFNNCIIATDYSQYYLRRVEKIPLKDNKILPFLQDNSDSKVDNNLTLVFFNRYKKTDYPFLITDDNPVMNTDGHCWNEIELQSIPCYQYPNLTRYFVSKDPITDNPVVSSLNFGTPSIAYNDDEIEYISENDTHGSECIYHKFWQAYLTDRFDQNCKILTAYFHLTLSDINANPLNKFIYINDTVWVVNKIVDFNPLNEQSTKVELVKVKDINNYIGQKYIEGEFKLYYPISPLTQLKGLGNFLSIDITKQAGNRTIRVNSTIDWEIVDYENLTPTQISTFKGTGSEQGKNTDITLTFEENDKDYFKYYYLYFQWGSKMTILEIIQKYGWTVEVIGNKGQVKIGENGEFKDQITEIFPTNTEITIYCQPNEGYEFTNWSIDDLLILDNNIPTLTHTVKKDTKFTAICSEPRTGWKTNNYRILLPATTVENVLYTPSGYTFKNLKATVNGGDGSEISFSYPLIPSTASTIKAHIPLTDTYKEIIITADIFRGDIKTSTESFTIIQCGNLTITLTAQGTIGNRIIYDIVDTRNNTTIYQEQGRTEITDTYVRSIQVPLPENPPAVCILRSHIGTFEFDEGFASAVIYSEYDRGEIRGKLINPTDPIITTDEITDTFSNEESDQ